jgi:hypothetical protein
MDATITTLLTWIAGLLAEAGLLFAAMFVLVLISAPLLFGLRAVLRVVRPYEAPPFGQHRGFRYWLENL